MSISTSSTIASLQPSNTAEIKLHRDPGFGGRWRGVKKQRPKHAVIAAVLLLVVGAIIWWVVRHRRQLAQDGDAWLAEATDDARDWRSDSQLVKLEGHGVAPDGTTPLLEDFQLTWRYEFMSPSFAEAPTRKGVPGAPAARQSPRCFGYSVSISKTGRSRLNADGGPTSCTTSASIATPLRCSIRKVWQRAKAAGAPDPAYAEIELKTSNGARTWHFEIVDHGKSTPMFTVDFPDDC